MDPQYNPDDIQSIIDAASNGVGGAASATPAAPTAPGAPTPDASTLGGSLFGRDRYQLVKGADGIDYSVDVTTGIATPIKGLPGQAMPTPKRIVKTSDGYSLVDPQTGVSTAVTGLPAPNVPAADQTVPGTGTAGGVNDPNASLDAYTTGGAYTPSTPDLTVAQVGAQTRQENAATAQQRADQAQANFDATQQMERSRLAIEQTNAELTRGRDAVTAAYNAGRLTLDQAKQAADMLYQQADIELKSRVANQDFGAKMADISMRRLPAGTLASFAPTAAAATQGRFVAPNIPQDTRDPTQIALNAIAQLKAGQGPQPAQAAFAAATPQSVGLTLPPAGGTAPYTPAAQPASQPAAAPPYFPRPGATTGPF